MSCRSKSLLAAAAAAFLATGWTFAAGDAVSGVLKSSNPATREGGCAARMYVMFDFRRAFGEEPPAVSAVAVATDTDNTGEKATAWYGDIVLEKRAVIASNG